MRSYPDVADSLDVTVIKDGKEVPSPTNGIYQFDALDRLSVSYRLDKSMDFFTSNQLNIKFINNNYGCCTTSLSVDMYYKILEITKQIRNLCFFLKNR